MQRDEAFAKKFADILVGQKILSVEKVPEILKKFAASSIEEFDAFLIDEGLAEHEHILMALEQYCHVPYFDVDGYFFDTFLLHKFPKDFLLRNAIIPLEVEDDMMMVVAAEPERPGLEASMGEYVSYDINFLVGIRRDICDAVKEFYDESVTEDIDDPEYHGHESDERRQERALQEDEAEQEDAEWYQEEAEDED